MSNIQQIKQISIRAYLAEQGLHPVKDNPRYGLYLSPLREEHSPSFKVDYMQNLWYDFGLGTGGSIIDLIMRLEQCDAGEAMRRLERHIGGMSVSPLSPSGFSSSRLGRAIQNSFALAPQRRFIGKNPIPQRTPSIIIERVQSLENPALLAYITERGINLDTVREHCSEVHYYVADKSYFAIGFCNDNGGWELRNRYFKGCTSKAPTTRRGDYPTCLVFEGFMDYLSFLTLKRNPTPPHNIVVLNSVTNLAKAVPFIASHEQVYTYLDNDEAGRKATAELKASCRNLSDQSIHYRPHNDLNDYLRSRCPVKGHKQSHGCKL